MALNIDESLVTTELTPALRERIITEFRQLITDYHKKIKGNRKFAAMINAIDAQSLHLGPTECVFVRGYLKGVTKAFGMWGNNVNVTDYSFKSDEYYFYADYSDVETAKRLQSDCWEAGFEPYYLWNLDDLAKEAAEKAAMADYEGWSTRTLATCKVEKCDFVPTSDLIIYPKYPIYATVNGENGKEELLIGYYNAKTDKIEILYFLPPRLDFSYRLVRALPIILPILAAVCALGYFLFFR